MTNRENTPAIEAKDLVQSFNNDFNATNAFKADTQITKELAERYRAFPLSIFPDPLNDAITDLEKEYNYCPCIIATSLLTAVSTAIGNSYYLDIDGSRKAIASMWAMVVGYSGTDKSGALKQPFKHFEALDKSLYSKYISDCKEYDLNKEMFATEPRLAKVMFDDYTPEALIAGHTLRLKGVFIYKDELKGLFDSFDRYSKGGEEAKMLKVWGGENVTVDRKGNRSIMLTSPNISIIGGIQPDLLGGLIGGKNKDRKHNGFLDRFLCCYPERLERKTRYGSKSNNDFDKMTRYILANIEAFDKNADNETYTAFELRYADGARSVIEKWDAENDKQSNNDFTPEGKSIRAKVAVYVHRFALILELLKCGFEGKEPTEISIDSCSRSTVLADYFLYQNFKVRGLILGDIADALPKELKAFYEALPEGDFTKSEAIDIGLKYGLDKKKIDNILQRKTLPICKVRHGVYAKE